jgi:hypothetical protein
MGLENRPHPLVKVPSSITGRSLSKVVVEPVTSKRFQQQFLNLPWQFHKHDPNWIPPLRGVQRELVNFKPHPFYLNAEVQTYVARRGAEVCGRIAAIDNFGHNERYSDDRVGFVGFFESIDDQQVANGLFLAAQEWFGKRNIQRMRGPTNPSLNHECGLLIDGFDSPPTFMMTYNPRYYPKLWEVFGFEKTQDLLSFEGDHKTLANVEEKIYFTYEEAKRRFKLAIRPINKKRFLEDVRIFMDIYNKSLVGTWGFVPIPDREIEHTSRALRRLIVPELALIAEIEGKPVGALFGLLDYNPRIKEIDGRLLPCGFMRLLGNRRAIKTLRMISTNVLPEYKVWGLGLFLHVSMIQPGVAWGLQTVEYSWVLESNQLSRKTLERAGTKLTKTHRIYDFAW